jgi:hypothetical protein
LGVGADGSGSEREDVVAESADSREIVIVAGGFSTTFAVPSICGRGQSNKIVANNIVFLLSVAASDAVLSKSTCLQQLNFTARLFRWHWLLRHISGGTERWDSGLGKGELMY